MAAAKNIFMRYWYRPEIVPIYVVTGIAVAGAGWYLTRLARGPDVTWDRKNNPYPWLNVDQNTQVKLIAINQKFDKAYSRDRF